MALPYELICRSEIKREDFNNKFVISIGGDGTLLAASHFCLDSPVLGVNSDPDTSIGALCIANKYNFRELINKIYANLIKPDPIQRLEIFYQDKLYNILALNDILYCHNNPAAMSRFSLSMGDQSEAHRASGVWVSSAAGSTGGIFSCGSPNYPIESQQALFRVREPYWCDHAQPALLAGSFKNQEFLYITSNMTDARIYIDGPHQFFDVRLGEVVKLKISSHPLWIFSAKELNQKREQIIIPRLAFRDLLYGEDRA
jgi:NAD+ kinase